MWAIGFALEVVADRQLAAFPAPAESRGRLMTTGLWRSSRHPNYLRELTMWGGLAVTAIAAPNGWIGIVGATFRTTSSGLRGSISDLAGRL
jgi:steroid 5-alpha reductase family enzyme